MKKAIPWILWIVSSLILAYYLVSTLQSDDKSLFLPGQTSVGHHQIELQCDACHGESFSDEKAMQKNCVSCHGEELKAIKDSHPKTKFTDPRNADRIKVLDARFCVTCHVEHKPDITAVMGVTKPDGFCIKCHKEIADDRPSHAGMGFETCASAGCHNYHDNRALYEDFLVKHAAEPVVKTPAVMPEITAHEHYFKRMKDKPALIVGDSDQPENIPVDSLVIHDWAASSHAEAAVNCSGCHTDKITRQWVEKPGPKQCNSCHQAQVKGFMEGKHGMRLKAELSPMRPGMSNMEFNPMRANHDIGCVSCHRDHLFNSKKASVEACTSCHTDEHTMNYKKSPHYQVWLQAQKGEIDAKAGVSCATCHMPAVQQKAGFLTTVATMHNQNMNLRPNEKMIRSACLNCHSLAFAIDALADETLIKNNFNGQPSIHIESVDMAVKRDN